MFALSAYKTLSVFDQALHSVHFLLCIFAVLIAFIPLLTKKGSEEHKFGGTLYVPVSTAAFAVACFIAWREASLVLFCFNGFCAYLLLSGWRALRAKDAPAFIDWAIPGGLFLLAVGMGLHALIYDEGLQSLYLLFFCFNGIYLAWRDYKSLKYRAYWGKHKMFFVDIHFGAANTMDWLNRHIAGMIGSAVANLSVVVLTLLPLSLHWLWPTALAGLAAYIAWKERSKKRRVHRTLAPVLQAKPRAPSPVRYQDDEDIRRAA